MTPSSPTPQGEPQGRAIMKTNDKVTFRDGRQGRVESVSQNNIAWIRDAKGFLTSVHVDTGYAGDGNWINEVPKTPNKLKP